MIQKKQLWKGGRLPGCFAGSILMNLDRGICLRKMERSGAGHPLTYLRNTCYANSQTIQQTLLCSEDEDERHFAVLYRKLPKQKQKNQDLISRSRAREPLLTCSMSKEEMKALTEKPMVIDNCCGHTMEM